MAPTVTSNAGPRREPRVSLRLATTWGDGTMISFTSRGSSRRLEPEHKVLSLVPIADRPLDVREVTPRNAPVDPK